MDFNWKEIHERLDTAWMKINNETSRAPEEVKKILKERAQLLSSEPEKQDLEGKCIDVLEFRLAYENYAVEISWVQEVQPLKSFVSLTGMPSFVMGIVNVRGQVYSLVDIKRFFELPDKGLSDLNKVIIIKNDDIEFGILVDSITGVKSVAVEELQPSLPTLTGTRQQYLMGVTPDQLIVLDAEKILTDKDLIVND